MRDLSVWIPEIKGMLDQNILIGPSLSGLGEHALEEDVESWVREEARLLRRMIYPEPRPLRGNLAVMIPDGLVEHALYESVAGTAAYLAHLQLGEVEIRQELVRVAGSLIERFVSEHDVDDVLSLHLMTLAYDDYLLVRHYGRVPEAIFLSGGWQRPWIRYSLQEELNFFRQIETLTVVTDSGEPYVTITDAGESWYQELRRVFVQSGYTLRRNLLKRWAEFSRFKGYDELVNRLGEPSIRNRLLDMSAIEPGMKVLELGCGTGALTLDCGLHRLVEPHGRIVATDPSIGMLSRARKKAEQLGVGSVQFLQAPAEKMPFDANEFDSVIGCLFLHFTDMPRVMREIQRVGKPGARFSTLVPLSFPQTSAFFREWFAPVFQRMPVREQQDMLPEWGTVPHLMRNWFEEVHAFNGTAKIDYGHPEDVVRFYVQVGNVFEAAMDELPWKAQTELIGELIEQGKEVVAKYPSDQLVQYHPTQYITGRIKQ